jgi:hypothetical protein
MAHARLWWSGQAVAVLGEVMKQRNALSFAILRISTVLAMLWALTVSPASAIPIRLTSGEILVENYFVFDRNATYFASLEGPGFLLGTDRYFDEFRFSLTGLDDHPLGLIPPGTITGFSGGMQIVSGTTPPTPGQPPPATVLYGGESYLATGDIVVSTPTAVVGPLITLPFTLSGHIHATDFMGTDLDFEIFGAGTVTASYFPYSSGFPDPSLHWVTPAVRYTIEAPPIPEPTSWLLFGSGFLGYAARRRSARRNG